MTELKFFLDQPSHFQFIFVFNSVASTLPLNLRPFSSRTALSADVSLLQSDREDGWHCQSRERPGWNQAAGHSPQPWEQHDCTVSTERRRSRDVRPALHWLLLLLLVISSIDCAGILKLRNSDIELRKGETDVGRKNTRVRLVFRTHLPLAPPVGPPGRVLALQVASLPIECCESVILTNHSPLVCEPSKPWFKMKSKHLKLTRLFFPLFSPAFSSGAARHRVRQPHFLLRGGWRGTSAERHQLPAHLQSPVHGERDR